MAAVATCVEYAVQALLSDDVAAIREVDTLD